MTRTRADVRFSTALSAQCIVVEFESNDVSTHLMQHGTRERVKLTQQVRRRLLAIANRPTAAAGAGRRCRAVLLSDDGVTASEIAERLALTAEAGFSDSTSVHGRGRGRNL
jgi:hypothetical protein